MPKSKAVKQAEAIERKRGFFHVYQSRWTAAHNVLAATTKSDPYYKHVLHVANVAERELVRAMKEAHVDRNGNPL